MEPFYKFGMTPNYLGLDENGLQLNQQAQQLPDGRWQIDPVLYGNQLPNQYDPATGMYIASNADMQNWNSGMEQWFKSKPQGDLMSWLGPALGMAAVGAIGIGAGMAGAEAAGGAVPESYWSMMADAAPGTTATDVAATGAGTVGGTGGAGTVGGTVGGTGSSMPSWATNYINSIGSPEWFGQQALSTGASQLSGGGNAGGGIGNWGGQEMANGQLAGVNAVTDGTNAGSGMFGQFGTNAIGSLLSGGVSALGANMAAKTQANAANNAAMTNLGMFNTINAQQAPWRQAGMNALADIQRLQPQFQHQFDANDLKTNLAPNYQFQLEQGLGATKNAANLQNGMLSGNTLQGINKFAQDYAGNAYQQAFNNYNANQTNIFNRLSNIAGLGQTANASTAGAGTAAAGNAGQAQTSAGAALAAGTVGATNALTGGANNALGWYTLPQLMNYGNG